MGTVKCVDGLDFPHQEVKVEGKCLREAREAFEKELMQRALARNRGNMARTATALGVSRPTLYDLVSKYALERWRGGVIAPLPSSAQSPLWKSVMLSMLSGAALRLGSGHAGRPPRAGLSLDCVAVRRAQTPPYLSAVDNMGEDPACASLPQRKKVGRGHTLAPSLRAVYRQGPRCLLEPGHVTEGPEGHLLILSDAERVSTALGDLWGPIPASTGEDIDEDALAGEIEESCHGQLSLSDTISAERREGPCATISWLAAP